MPLAPARSAVLRGGGTLSRSDARECGSCNLGIETQPAVRAGPFDAEFGGVLVHPLATQAEHRRERSRVDELAVRPTRCLAQALG